MGAMGSVAVEVRGVALGIQQGQTAADEGAIVKAVRCWPGETEVVPRHIQAEVVSFDVVVVGVGIVETPVGDADIYALAVEEGVDGAFQPPTLLHTVGAGVEARVVAFYLGNGVRDTVLQYFFATVQ